MKKLALALSLLVASTVASAHGWEGHGGYRGGGYGHYENHYRGGGYNNWVAPALIGGIIGYELSQPRTVYVQPPVVYQQPQVVYQTPYCTPWTETVDQYGAVTRTRTCTQ